MDRQRIKTLYALIAGLADDEFDMGTFGPAVDPNPHCGTAACIGGWALTLDPATARGAKGGDVSRIAGGILDLTYGQAKALFLGDCCPHDLRRLTREDALRAIDHLLETGRPAWPAWFRPVAYSDDDIIDWIEP